LVTHPTHGTAPTKTEQDDIEAAPQKVRILMLLLLLLLLQLLLLLCVHGEAQLLPDLTNVTQLLVAGLFPVREC
jgi:hypothetical protein